MPIATTTVGCEGLDVEHGVHALVGDTPEAFADAVVRLLRDAELRRQLVAHAAAHVRRFDWTAIGDRLDHVFPSASLTMAPRACAGFGYAADSN